ncbi:MAG: hypothetical protein R3Y45_02290 [Bacillota bacterium]
MSAIKELYYGNIGSHESITPSVAWKKASDVEYEQNDKLEAMLTKEQNAEFDKFKDLMMERTAVECADIFEYAFGIGVALGYESAKNIRNK